jgi:hypothetical protein
MKPWFRYGKCKIGSESHSFEDQFCRGKNWEFSPPTFFHVLCSFPVLISSPISPKLWLLIRLTSNFNISKISKQSLQLMREIRTKELFVKVYKL